MQNQAHKTPIVITSDAPSPISEETLQITDSEISEAMSDLRVMVCAQAAYEAYRRTYRLERGWEPMPWKDVIARPGEAKFWVAAALGTLKTWRAGSTGKLSRSNCGTGRLARSR